MPMPFAKPESVGLSSERLARLRPALQPWVDRGQVAGFSTLVARHGQIASLECFGQADIARQIPVAPDTIWRVYSMTKPITSVAALMLYERGLYHLNEPISAFVPAFKNPQVLLRLKENGETETVPARREITVLDVFRHTSGLTYGGGTGDIDKVYQKAMQTMPPGATTAEIVDGLATLPLAYHPGEEYIYSLSNDVLGRLVEVLSGKRFGQFLQEELFEPLGMADTGFYVPEPKRGRFAELYQVADGLTPMDSAHRPAYDAPPPYESGGGGLVSTILDYGRFAAMLANGGELDGVRLLGRKTVQMLSTNYLTPQQQVCFDQRLGKRGYGYGLAVRVMVNPGGANTAVSVGEFGWDGAASTWFMVDPAEDMVAVHMIQMMPFGYYPIMWRFQALAYQALL